MRIFLDDEPIDSPATTLGGAIARVAQDLGERLLIEARADGRLLPHDELTNPPDTDPFARELRFCSARPVDLARVTLHDAGVVVGELKGEHAKTADLIEAGSTEQISAALTRVFTVWGQVLTALDIISRTPSIPWPPRTDTVDQAAIDARTASLKAHLAEVKSALSLGDWAGLCDILRYELDDQAAAWKTLCNNLADAMSDSPRENRETP